MLKLSSKWSNRKRLAVVVLGGHAAAYVSLAIGFFLSPSARDLFFPTTIDHIKSFIAPILIYGAGFIGGLFARTFSISGRMWMLYTFAAIYISINATVFLLVRLGDHPEPQFLGLIAAHVIGVVVCLGIFGRPAKSEVQPPPEEPPVS